MEGRQDVDICRGIDLKGMKLEKYARFGRSLEHEDL